MKKLFTISSLIFFLFASSVSFTFADFANGASTETNDLPFAESKEALVLSKNQNQYFFDPSKTNITTDGDFTLEAWIKLNQFQGGGSWIVTKDDGLNNRQFGLSAADIQKLALQVKGVGNINSSNTSLQTGIWTHIAAVWHSSTHDAEFYINGQLDSTANNAAVIPTSSNSAELEIGRRADGNNNMFDGKIAEVRIWNIARNSNEIFNNYNHSLVGNESGLIAYYPIWSQPLSSDLSIPLLKQTSNPWQSQVYDTANKWNPADPSINAFGCALTSAAMVLQYHGIKKLPDGTTLDPGTLNTWLNAQKDGYVGEGLLNWLAVSRLSKLAKNINNITSFDALEYKRLSGSNTAQLTTDLNDKLPDILEEPGHFVVAKGITQNSFSINDPFFDRSDLASYSGTFLSLGRYVPSHTDLSYIMVVLDTNISGILKNSSGSAVGDTFIQNGIQNPLNPSQHSSSKRFFYLSQPIDGTYTLDLTSPQTTPYNAAIYLYDQNGNVITITQPGIIHGNGKDSITIPFKKTGNDDKKIAAVVTFQSIIQDITDLRILGDIKKEKLKNDLILLMQKAEAITQAKKLKKEELKEKFEDFLEDIKHNRKKDLSENGYQILLNDIQILKNIYLK